VALTKHQRRVMVAYVLLSCTYRSQKSPLTYAVHLILKLKMQKEGLVRTNLAQLSSVCWFSSRQPLEATKDTYVGILFSYFFGNTHHTAFLRYFSAVERQGQNKVGIIYTLKEQSSPGQCTVPRKDAKQIAPLNWTGHTFALQNM